MTKVPESTKSSLQQRLASRARERWPALASISVKHRASHDDYEDSYLPNGTRAGTAENALDCACGLYLNDPIAQITPPTN